MDRWQQIDDLFAQALAHPAAERASVLAGCPDADVRREVASLLDHHPTADLVLEGTVGQAVNAWAATHVDREHASVIGRRSGAYEITGIIGYGGMGAVYRARRADGAFEHDVAIKVVRHGFETPAALDRFRLERQILARLTHAGIARLLDGGTTRDEHGADIPYLVLEYVDGTSITTFCTTRALAIADRLVLFRRVLDAVLHAHQRLVVHRDLKPGNILVTSDGQPKLLDFGIAKLLTDAADSATPVTAAGATLLTPEYASPEQIRGEPITVATDVYALGAILYELLTDRQAHRFETRSTAEIHHIVCDAPVTKPSASVGDDGRRRRLLAGDLDTIVLKALHKDPARRYASVDQLSEDLRLYLAGLPVTAQLDTTLYRVGKFVRRNKTLVAALVLAIASLAGGLAISLQQTRRANARFNDVRTLANRLLKEVEPAMRRVPGTANAKRLLANMGTEYLDRLRADAGNDPDLLIEIAEGYVAVGRTEGSIDGESFGRYGASKEAHDKALAIAQPLLDAGRSDVRLVRLVAVIHLTYGELASVKPAWTEALAQYQEAIVIAERGLATEPNNAALVAIRSSAEIRGADVLLGVGRVAEAAALLEKSLAGIRASKQPVGTITTRARLAIALRESGSPDRAVALFRECVDETRKSMAAATTPSSGDPHTLTLLQADIGLTLAGREGPSLGATDEGLASFRAALDTGRSLMRASNDNPNSVLAWGEAAVGFGTVAAEIDAAAAAATLSESAERLAPLLKDNGSDARLLDARGRSALARALTLLRRYGDADTHAHAAVAALQTLLDADRESAAFGDALVMARVHLGEARAGLGDRAGADDQLRQAVGLAEQLTAATPERPRAKTLLAIAQARRAALAAARSTE